MLEEAGIYVSDAVVDWAHQIGQGYSDSKTKQKCKRIIICSQYLDIELARSRKENLKKRVKVHLGLTKRRYKLVQGANNLVKGNNWN